MEHVSAATPLLKAKQFLFSLFLVFGVKQFLFSLWAILEDMCQDFVVEGILP